MARGGRVKEWEHRIRLGDPEKGLVGPTTHSEMEMAGYEAVSVTWCNGAWWTHYRRAWYPMRQWTPRECRLMNLLDFRYWRCECEYVAPYGKVIFGGCEKHD